MDELLARQRKELRDLQSQITQKKKQATKKTRKSVNSECDVLDQQVKARHTREIQQLEIPTNDTVENVYISPPSPSLPLSDDEPIGNLSLPASLTPPNPTNGTQRPRQKKNRQKERLARRAAEAAALAEAAETEASSLPNFRERELAAMSSLLKSNNLKEFQITPDGHCLYSAVLQSLRSAGVDSVPTDYREARKKCAEFMRSHPDDFAPFLEEDLEEHVRKVESTAEWGGHTEVLALGRAFNVIVNVVQTGGRRMERINEGEGKEGEIWLGFYRHAFGLGEHYNSLVKEQDV